MVIGIIQHGAIRSDVSFRIGLACFVAICVIAGRKNDCRNGNNGKCYEVSHCLVCLMFILSNGIQDFLVKKLGSLFHHFVFR